MSRSDVRGQRRELRRRARARRRGGDGRPPVFVQRVTGLAHATRDGTQRAWDAARSGDRPMAVALVVVVVLGVTMLAGPTQRYLDSDTRVDDLQAKASALEAENDLLHQRKQDLTDDEYVELLAREQQGLVRPGEVPYTLVPPEVERPQISAPHQVTATREAAWYERAWTTVRNWLE